MGWISTAGGHKVDYEDPDPDEITIEDIARGLSNICRFAGQIDFFYSVAQHSILVAERVPVQHALAGLLHDASEAYCQDIPRDLKQMLPDYKVIEDRMMGVILTKFGLPAKLPPSVKEADNRLLLSEKRDLQPRGLDWGWKLTPYPEKITPWAPHIARVKFLAMFTRLSKEQEACVVM